MWISGLTRTIPSLLSQSANVQHYFEWNIKKDIAHLLIRYFVEYFCLNKLPFFKHISYVGMNVLSLKDDLVCLFLTYR